MSMCQPVRENCLLTPFDLKPQDFAPEGESVQCTNEQWDFNTEKIAIFEELTWLRCNTHYEVTENVLSKWPKECKPKTSIHDECNFCDEAILHQVLKAKDIFNELNSRELYRARARANPFETIHSMFFMNRAALKMANIDAATNFIFTNIDQNAFHKQDSGPYYFADVCAGPGGFTEYVLWRKKWLFKGFGLTLRDEHDFTLTESVCASPVTFLPLYGAKGDGNVCCPKNIDDFTEKVLHETTRGVHFVMSDGGFSVDGIEDMQEVLSKNIYICQCLIALKILRKHGHFVTKFFDIFTSFSVGLLYFLYHCFEKICIFKPNSSRPANSERYVVCYNFKGDSEVDFIKTYLTNIVNRLWDLKDNADLDVIEIVDLDILKNDQHFYSYIYDSNNSMAKRQTIHLQKLGVFCRNPTLTDFRQEQIRMKSLEYWQIPDKSHLYFPKTCTEDLLFETDTHIEIFEQPREFRDLDDLKNVIFDSQNWQYIPMQCKRKTNVYNVYAGMEMSRVYKYQHKKWVRVKNMQLIRGTLLSGEMVKETSVSETGDLHFTYSLHVLDALRLGDVHLGDLSFNERISLIQTYCTAVSHEFRKNTTRIRAKTPDKLCNWPGRIKFQKKQKVETCMYTLPTLGYKTKEEFHEVHSVLLKTTESQFSTYILRKDLLVDDASESDDNFITLQVFINHLKVLQCSLPNIVETNEKCVQ